jgi:CheY-like chemotaxis protein
MAPPSIHGLSLLVLEDDALVRRALVRQFSSLGCTSHACSDGAAALELACDASVKIDVALMDLHLGAETAIDVVPRVLEARPKLPILILSASCSVEEERALLAAGVVEVLAKPCSTAVLSEKIGALVR